MKTNYLVVVPVSIEAHDGASLKAAKKHLRSMISKLSTGYNTQNLQYTIEVEAPRLENGNSASELTTKEITCTTSS